MSLPLAECLREARSIPCFNGTDDYTLLSYLRDVNLILALTSEDERPIIERVLSNKLRGKALRLIELLPNATFGQMLEKLKEELGVPNTFMNLRIEAMKVKANNKEQLYNKLSSILNKMYCKYFIEGEHEVLYTPINNEKLIFDIYCNFLPCYIKVLLIQNDIQTIEKAKKFYIANNLVNDFEIVTGPNCENGYNNGQRKNFGNFNNNNQYDNRNANNGNKNFNNKGKNSGHYNSNNNYKNQNNNNRFSNSGK